MMPLPGFSLREDTKISPAIHAALVDSLFQNPIPLLAGAICTSAAAVMTAVKTGNVWLWPCAVFLIAVGIARAMDMAEFQKVQGRLTPADAPRWERRYRSGAVLYAASLGAWCLIALLGSDDPVAHMLCTTVTIAFVAGGAGRSFGRPAIFQQQIILACGPMVVGLLASGGLYYIGLGLLNGLFFIGLKQITSSLQQIFVRAFLATEREAETARQFNTALNNMPNGLCMFGADGRLAVVNRHFSDMMGLRHDAIPVGKGMSELLAPSIRGGHLSGTSAQAIAAAAETGRAVQITTSDDGIAESRALEWTFQPMERGGIVVLVEDVTERRNAEAKISHMARFDELTGLPNRQWFRDNVERMLLAGDNGLCALLFVDLDQFKQVNDTLGHPCGDMLLCSVADRLREIVRHDALIGRFGGDEFVVFLRHMKSLEDASEQARRIVERLSERYEIDHHFVEIGASIGIAEAPAGLSADTILKNADMALYRAKADGRGTFCFFRQEMAEMVEARRTLEIDLRRALVNEEFEIYYQPLVNLKSGRISTCEALLRWRHPTRGTVSPADIIPVAEEMGLIVDLGRWILRKACMECMKWPEPVRVAVNLSPLQFHQRNVLDDVRYALRVSGLPAERLELEITESSLIRNTQWVRDALQKLRDEGISISLDDFGTGYSSLSYLHKFPLQKVKIDRSFLEGIGEDRPLTLLRGVARLSADLGMSVVVEGVETNEQLEIVAADGTVTEVQGYLFSKPVTARQVRQLLATSHGRKADAALARARHA